MTNSEIFLLLKKYRTATDEEDSILHRVADDDRIRHLIIETLNSEASIKEKNQVLFEIRTVLRQRNCAHEKDVSIPALTQWQGSLFDLIGRVTLFEARYIPREKWADLGEELLQLLLLFLNEGHPLVDYNKDPRFVSLWSRVTARRDDLYEQGFEQAYGMWG
jgi:hypothetical protein